MSPVKSYHDIVGDGGSDVLGQVVEQRGAIAEALSGVKHLVAVGSGKGGVGKSTTTMQLAQSLLARGWRVAVLDADLNGPSQARLGGVLDAPALPGENGLLLPRSASGLGVLSLGSFLGAEQPLEFDSVAPGDQHTWRATREFSAFAEILAGVEWGELDALLIDLPPGAERTRHFVDFLGAQTSLIVVTIPSLIATGVVRRSLQALKGSPVRILGTLENMQGYLCPDCGKVQPLFPAPGVDLGVTSLGSIPFDPQLAAMCDQGAALTERPELASAQAFTRLAETVATALETQPR